MADKISYLAVVIGCGGNGTHLSSFFQYWNSSIRDCPVKGIAFVDADRVEEKNLARQGFYEDSVGAYKVNAYVEQITATFPDLQNKVVAVAKYINSATDIKDVFTLLKGRTGNSYTYNAIPLVIGAVDNNAARKAMEDFFNEERTCVYYDAGNDFMAGEVVFSYKRENTVISPLKSTYDPSILKGELKPRDEMSCTELNSVAPQHILVNCWAGLILTSALINLCEGHTGIAMVIFDSRRMYMQAIPIAKAAVKKDAPKKGPAKKAASKAKRAA